MSTHMVHTRGRLLSTHLYCVMCCALFYRLLYDVLTDPVFERCAPPLVVACNKQDLVTSQGSVAILTKLQTEM